MSLNQSTSEDIKPWLSTRVFDMYLDNGLEPGCLVIPSVLDSYFISNGTVPVPTPKSNFSASLKLSRVELIPTAFLAGVSTFTYNPVLTIDNIPGLTVSAPDTIEFAEPGQYLIVMNYKYKSLAIAGCEFHMTQSFSNENDYHVSEVSTGGLNTAVYSKYVNITSGMVPYSNKATCIHFTGGLAILAESHFSIIKLGVS